eukprot:9483945-Pyramimonas_sp.AAC.1
MLEAEVVAAQRAVAASAAGSSGVDLANLASTLVGLQAILRAKSRGWCPCGVRAALRYVLRARLRLDL